MTEDQQTYKRATTAALAGLGVQLLVGVVVAVLAVWAQSAALNAAMWHLFGGFIIWGALWLVYNQHRLERLEALESEQLAAEAGNASMFDEAGHDLALARKRLEGFYRWGLNVVSITMAVYLLTAGVAMLWGYGSKITTEPGEPANFTALQAIALGNPNVSVLALMLTSAALALVGFLTARYVAGMTEVRQWQMLRGGAAFLMGNVVVLVGVIAACVLQLIDYPHGFTALTLLIPVVMIVLGVEVVLSFVFGAYRPRKPGELVRPAFDSRLLGWLTRPESLGKIVAETLNYQFGFEISRSWFMQIMAKTWVWLVMFGVFFGTLLFMSAVVIVPPQQQALVTTLGAVDEATSVRQPGISFKAPWPFATAEKFDVSRVQTLRVGSFADQVRLNTAMLWTNQHVEGQERYLVTAPARGADDDLSGGYSAALAGGELVLQWRISDLLDYTSADAPDKPDRVLRAVAESYLTEFMAGRDIDALLTTARLQENYDFRGELQRRVDDAGLGVQVLYAGLYGIHPPQDAEVAASFLRAVNALITQRTTIANAERERVATLSQVAGSVERAREIDEAIRQLEVLSRDAPQRGERAAEVQRLIDQAGGDAARVLAEARADRWRLALGEQARAQSFDFELEAYRRAPLYFPTRMYLEALAEALPSVRKIVTTNDTTEAPIIRLNLEDESSGLDTFISGE